MDRDDKTRKGYIILARATLTESKTWSALTLERKAMMTMLIMMANHESQTCFNGREKITVNRGQTFTSLPSLVEAFGKGATIQKIRSCLLLLGKLGFLTDEPTGNGRVISLINYDFWSDPKKYQQANQQRANRQPTANKKGKKDPKEDLIYVNFVSWFNEEFKVNHKPETFREKIEARLKDYTLDQLKTAALVMKRDLYMMGENDHRKVYATLEYITRNNINVDKWLNMAQAKAQTEERREIHV